LTVTALKVFADLDRIGAMVRVTQVAAVRSVEAWMSDRELEKAAGLKNAIAFGEHAIGFRNIHQTHECSGEIKSGIGKWQVDCAGLLIVDPERRFFFSRLRMSDEDFGDIDPC